jgi:Transcriptional regulator containing PAS, AAA-type ATPase, and DNA-binding domains
MATIIDTGDNEAFTGINSPPPIQFMESLMQGVMGDPNLANVSTDWRTGRWRTSNLGEGLGQGWQLETLIGQSPRMQEIYRLVEQVSPTTVPVLLTGESGTGKDLLAQVIHSQGLRARGPFIAVNCAALPETLLESEFFGSERGAFTGAIARKGRFELADGGTLFLDEVGELSPTAQAKLLRVLERQEFERVGGTRTLKVDVRVIAATNQDLDRLIQEGRFRKDLFYRLNIYPIPLPPLRERREDLLPLVRYFLHKYSQEQCKEVVELSPEVRELLISHDWPGNVRELESVLRRAVILCQGNRITVQELPPALQERRRAPPVRTEAFTLPPDGINLEELEKQLILQALKRANSNQSKASQLLGFSRSQLRTRLKRHKLTAELRACTKP